MPPNFFLTEDNYRALVKSGEWSINDIPLPLAEQIRNNFGISSSFALFSSGLAPETIPTGKNLIVGGFDWIRAEDKLRAGERPLNSYHYLIGSPENNFYPVYHCGHSGVLTPSGWCELNDLNIYFQNGK